MATILEFLKIQCFVQLSKNCRTLCLPAHSFIYHPFIHSFICPFTHSSIHSFTLLGIHSFIHPLSIQFSDVSWKPSGVGQHQAGSFPSWSFRSQFSGLRFCSLPSIFSCLSKIEANPWEKHDRQGANGSISSPGGPCLLLVCLSPAPGPHTTP